MFVVGLTTLAALVVALGKAEREESGPLWRARWGSLFEARHNASRADEGQLHLIDRENGGFDSLVLPPGERWEYVGISPWSDVGKLEAVGRYYRLDAAEKGFGLARIRLPEGEIVERIQANVPPTSQPCWVPGRPGRVVFAAGDGRLYRCDFSAAGRLAAGSREEGRGPQELEWRCTPPPNVPLFFADPALCSDPRHENLAVATLISQPDDLSEKAEQSTSLWWLRLNTDATAIEACGLLRDDRPEYLGAGRRLQRHPILSVSRDGDLELIHLSSNDRMAAMDMVCVPLEVDPQTGIPRLRAGSRPTTIAAGCALVPPVVDADGRTAYGCSQTSGRPMKSPIRPELGEGPTIAGVLPEALLSVP